MFLNSLLILSRLKPKILYQASSPISGEIKVIQTSRERKLVVGKVTQSVLPLKGPVTGVWQSLMPRSRVEKVLIMGLGGGTLAQLLLARYADVKITAYEIDPLIVKVAREFFSLSKKITIRVADAREAFKDNSKYDLVVVDLYSGRNAPSFTDDYKFITQVKSRISPDGSAVFNRVALFDSQARLARFELNLKKSFQNFKVDQFHYNRLYWVDLEGAVS